MPEELALTPNNLHITPGTSSRSDSIIITEEINPGFQYRGPSSANGTVIWLEVGPNLNLSVKSPAPVPGSSLSGTLDWPLPALVVREDQICVDEDGAIDPEELTLDDMTCFSIPSNGTRLIKIDHTNQTLEIFAS